MMFVVYLAKKVFFKSWLAKILGIIIEFYQILLECCWS